MDQEHVQTDQDYQSHWLPLDLDTDNLCEDIDHFVKNTHPHPLQNPQVMDF